MVINPAMNHDACFNVIGDTEIIFDVLDRFFTNKSSMYQVSSTVIIMI